MRTVDFADFVRLGIRAKARRPWEPVTLGTIVSIPKGRYGASIQDEKSGEVRYFDSTWVISLDFGAGL